MLHRERFLSSGDPSGEVTNLDLKEASSLSAAAVPQKTIFVNG
jgi:hypothetical protein